MNNKCGLSMREKRPQPDTGSVTVSIAGQARARWGSTQTLLYDCLRILGWRIQDFNRQMSRGFVVPGNNPISISWRVAARCCRGVVVSAACNPSCLLFNPPCSPAETRLHSQDAGKFNKGKF